jgi:hypothetical protein
MKRGVYFGSEVRPGNEEIRLEERRRLEERNRLVERLAAALEARGGLKGDPEGLAAQMEFVIALLKLDFGQFTDGDDVAGRRALEVDVLLGHDVNGEVAKMLVGIAHRVGLAGHGLIERFRVILNEGEGA